MKDITEKILETYNDVFADIVNVLLFDRKEVLRADEKVKMFKSDFRIVADYFVQLSRF